MSCIVCDARVLACQGFFAKKVFQFPLSIEKRRKMVKRKGTCQKLLSVFFSVKGGGGSPPFPLRVFGQDDFPLSGEGGPGTPGRSDRAACSGRNANSLFCSAGNPTQTVSSATKLQDE